MLPFLPDARRVRTCAMRLRVCRVLHGRLHFGSAVPARVRVVPKIGVPGVSCVAWKVEVLGPSGMLGGVSAPGLSGKRAVSGSLRSALVSWLSPRPGFPRVPVSSVYRFLVRRPSPDSRLPDRRMYRFVSIYFDAKSEKKTETAESVLRSGLKPVLNRLVYAGFGLPESI